MDEVMPSMVHFLKQVVIQLEDDDEENDSFHSFSDNDGDSPNANSQVNQKHHLSKVGRARLSLVIAFLAEPV